MSDEDRKLQRDHIGDGIYVATRNGQIEISVNNHANPPVAYLDRYTAQAMKRYIDRVFETPVVCDGNQG